MSISKKEQRRRQWMMAIGIAIAVASIGGHFGKFTWILDLSSHFRLVYVWVFFLLSVFFVTRQQWRVSAVFSVLCLINASIAFAYAVPKVEIAKAGTKWNVRVMQMNIWDKNNDYKHVRDCIYKEDPDIIGIEEYTGKAESAFANLGLFQRYPHHLSIPEFDGGSEVALISKFPVKNIRLAQSSPKRDQTVIADVTIGSKTATVVVMHPTNPVRREPYERNCLQLKALAALRDKLDGDLIVIGDMNTTHFSPTFNYFLKAMRLRDAREGFGPIPTWPALVPLIPIDYVLVSPTIHVNNFRTASPTGSDHVAVLADLTL